METTSILIDVASIFISVASIVEQAGDIDNGEAASLKIDIGHQCGHERHQPRAGGRLDLQNVLRWQVQHGTYAADLSAVECGGPQSDQLSVVVRSRFRRPLVGLHFGRQKRAAYGLGFSPVGQLGKPDQQPARVITNRAHREVPRSAFLPKYLTRGEAPLRLIGAELYRNLTLYTVRPSDDTHDGVGVQLLAPLPTQRLLRLP
jgi:hypothetical protein